MQVPDAVNHMSLDYQVAAFDSLDQMEAMNFTQQLVSVSAEPGVMCEEWAGASRSLGSPGNRILERFRWVDRRRRWRRFLAVVHVESG
jgi:hypothetical protein